VRLGLTTLVALTACATLSKLTFHEPDLQLQEINVTVYNPNEYRIRSTRLEVGVDLEGTHFGDALLERPLDLSPTNHSRVAVPVRFEWSGVGAGAKALLTRRAVAYGLTGAVLLETPLGDQRVTLHGSGNVPLKPFIR